MGMTVVQWEFGVPFLGADRCMDFLNLETTLDVEGVGRDTGWRLRLKYMIYSGTHYLKYIAASP